MYLNCDSKNRSLQHDIERYGDSKLRNLIYRALRTDDDENSRWQALNAAARILDGRDFHIAVMWETPESDNLRQLILQLSDKINNMLAKNQKLEAENTKLKQRSNAPLKP